MSTETYSPRVQGREHRKNWKEDLPPKQYRVTVEEAIEMAGNANRLANLIGVSRQAIYQWYPPFRLDPYMPVISAMKLLGVKGMRAKLKGIRS